MNTTFIKTIRTSVCAAILCAGLTLTSIPRVQANDGQRVPEIPATCGDFNVPSGHKVAFHTYALGVQIYRWNGTNWVFVAPAANLYADANYRGKVGTHYGGPTWESNSGSIVVARRMKGCSVDSSAIDWLLLQATSSGGAGIFDGVTYIHRVNTVGGKAPTTPGLYIGEEARIPYTTEYYFYRAQD